MQPDRTTEERDRLAIVTSLNYTRQVIKLLPVSECQQAKSGILTSNLQTGQLRQQGAWNPEAFTLEIKNRAVRLVNTETRRLGCSLSNQIILVELISELKG